MNGKSRPRYAEVMDLILKNEVLCRNENERLPSRTDLIKKYGVTRTTVERAISELIGGGYLYALDGSGTYVAKQGRKTDERKTVSSWGIILPNILFDTYPGILRGIEDITSENGINAIVCNSDGNEEKQERYIDQLIESSVEGMIIVPPYIPSRGLEPYKKLNQNNIRFVFCNRAMIGVPAPFVCSNNYFGGYLATRHLIETGHKKIAYISRPLYQTSLERFMGYKAALAEAHLEIDESFVIFDTSFYVDNSGYNSMQQLLKSGTRPDAVFCFNDMIAKGVYQALQETGIAVGKDVAIIGYDNTGICEALPIKLSSVNFFNYEIGRKAALILLEMTRGELAMRQSLDIFQPELVVRESSLPIEQSRIRE